MRQRKAVSALIVISGIVASSALIGVPAASAASPPASGTVRCSVLNGGSGRLTPGLKPIGIKSGEKIKFAAKLKCTSKVKKPKNVVVTGGSMTGVGYFNAGSSGGTSCVAFDFDDVGVITVTINWTTTGGGIAPTKIVYSGGANPNTPVPASGPYRIRLSAGGVKQAGSSFVPPATPHLVQIQTNLPSVCSSGTYSAFTIAGGAVAM